MVNVQKRLNGASVKADFWHGEKGYPEKKLKIATFAEAPFMVKLDFLNNKYFFHISVYKLLESKIRIIYKASTRPFFLLELFDKCIANRKVKYRNVPFMHWLQECVNPISASYLLIFTLLVRIACDNFICFSSPVSTIVARIIHIHVHCT